MCLDCHKMFLFFCQLYNYFEDANYVYLILEMCHNKEINRYLKKTGRPVGENEGMVHTSPLYSL